MKGHYFRLPRSDPLKARHTAPTPPSVNRWLPGLTCPATPAEGIRHKRPGIAEDLHQRSPAPRPRPLPASPRVPPCPPPGRPSRSPLSTARAPGPEGDGGGGGYTTTGPPGSYRPQGQAHAAAGPRRTRPDRTGPSTQPPPRFLPLGNAAQRRQLPTRALFAPPPPSDWKLEEIFPPPSAERLIIG